MHPGRRLACILLLPLSLLLLAGGCRRAPRAAQAPLPADTILLSQMMREISAQPGFTARLLEQLEDSRSGEPRRAAGKRGPALLTPQLAAELRRRITGSEWSGLDRFPGWTMKEITPAVRVLGGVAGRSEALEAAAVARAGRPGAMSEDAVRQFLDLGPYSLSRPKTVALDQPTRLPGLSAAGSVIPLGDGVTRGDGPSALAAEHAESQRLADVLNRLAANRLSGARKLVAVLHLREARSPEQLIEALEDAGEDVRVDDARYFANFGHLHYQPAGQDHPLDVMMPFWVNTGIAVPQSGGRALLLPVSHAEYEFHVHGPAMNADVSYYFGIDGKSEWRTMDTLDQAWVMGRNAHEYTGYRAVEVTRLAGLLTVAYLHQHERRPRLPFGGYFALGVCQDGVSAIEQHMTGHVTLYPNTVDIALFDDPRDAEVNALLAAIPKDRDGARPNPERVFGSLPLVPGPLLISAFNAVTIPGLAPDLNATYAAWKSGELGAPRHGFTNPRLLVALVALFATAILITAGSRRFSAQEPKKLPPPDKLRPQK